MMGINRLWSDQTRVIWSEQDQMSGPKILIFGLVDSLAFLTQKSDKELLVWAICHDCLRLWTRLNIQQRSQMSSLVSKLSTKNVVVSPVFLLHDATNSTISFGDSSSHMKLFHYFTELFKGTSVNLLRICSNLLYHPGAP